VKKKRFQMSFRLRRGLTPPFFIFLIVLIAASAAVNTQTRTGVATAANIDFGTVGRGGSAQRDVILTNPGNNSTLTYSINFTDVTNTSGQLTAIPSSGAIAPKSNVTLTVMLDVLSDANEGNYSSSMAVNSTAQSLGGGSTALPARLIQVTYTIQGNAPTQTALIDIDVPLVTGVLFVFALVAIGAVYVILKRR
jgi:hypothetical protein